MPIEVQCLLCNKVLKAKDSMAGRTAKCPSCGSKVTIPAAKEEVIQAELAEDFESPDSEDAPDDEPKRRPCPMCGEPISARAVRCRYCGEELSGKKRKRSNREGIKAIAIFQKGIILSILAYLAAVALGFALREEAQLVFGVCVLGVGIMATVFVFQLATKVYSTGTGVVLGILTLIPCVGLIVLLIINGKATSVLKDHGIAVGFLGARMSDFD